MTTKTIEPENLTAPATATNTSDYPISITARRAFVAALERADDLAIALEVRARSAGDRSDRMELEDFIRGQGYDPADFEA